MLFNSLCHLSVLCVSVVSRCVSYVQLKTDIRCPFDQALLTSLLTDAHRHIARRAIAEVVFGEDAHSVITRR